MMFGSSELVIGNTLFITRIIVASVNVISSPILNFMCTYMSTRGLHVVAGTSTWYCGTNHGYERNATGTVPLILESSPVFRTSLQ
jgi:hypothetical protein